MSESERVGHSEHPSYCHICRASTPSVYASVYASVWGWLCSWCGSRKGQAITG